jgi:quercetin dioxygenase-like cupin family protein
MDIKANEATGQRPKGGRVIDAPLVNISLAACIEQIRHEETWKKSDRNAITIFKSAMMRIVLIALHKDAEMKEHSAAGNISIQVIEGEMLFSTAAQTVILGRGQMLALHEAIPHSELARSETVFLLTLTTVYAKRVL